MTSRATPIHLPLSLFIVFHSMQVCADESLALEQALQKAQTQPWAIEVYYEIRDGYEQEFLELYKKNHWPVLSAEIDDGSLISVDIDAQQFAPPGGHKWDYRVTMVFTNILYRHEFLERSQEEIIDRLYPDRERFDLEERRRMEIIEYGYILDRTRLPTAEWATEPLHK